MNGPVNSTETRQGWNTRRLTTLLQNAMTVLSALFVVIMTSQITMAIFIYSCTHPACRRGCIYRHLRWRLTVGRLMSNAFCASSFTVTRDFCHVCTPSATIVWRNYWTTRPTNKPPFYVLRASNRLPLPSKIFPGTSISPKVRTPLVACLSSWQPRFVRIVRAKRSRARFVTTVASMAS